MAAAALGALATPAIYFGSRAMSEVACALPLAWGLALLAAPAPPAARCWRGPRCWAWRSRSGSRWRRWCWGGGLPGAPAAVADPGLASAALAGWALAYGAPRRGHLGTLPGARLGGWFHSVFVYYRFNVTEGRGAHWGTADWVYYPRTLFTSMPTVALALAAGLGGGAVAAAVAGAAGAGAVPGPAPGHPHKEYPLPLPGAAAGAPWWERPPGLPAGLQGRASALVALLGLGSTLQLGSLTMG